MFSNAYQGKRIFVTGHTGFKGSWLCLWLEKLGAEVTGFSVDVPTNPAHFSTLKLKTKDLRGSILDVRALNTAIMQAKPDLVFHLAAQPLVRESYRQPVATFATNVMGTLNVLEACRGEDSIKGIINVTSDKCYENTGKKEGYSETDPMGGHDPYSASKACAEIVARSYRSAFADVPPLASVRAGNVIGGGDFAADRLVPDIARAITHKKPLVIRSPSAVRPWQHVLEPLSGYLLLGEHLLNGKKKVAGDWNFGPIDAGTLTVEAVLKRLQEKLSFTYEVEKADAALHEAAYLNLNSSKAMKELGWKPVWSTDRMLEKTAEWYAAYLKKGTALSAEQLDAYIHDAKGHAWAS